MESDKETTDAMGRTVIIQYNWDEIKSLFDINAKLRVTGVKTGNSDTDALIFRGSICISQNTMVEGSEAIITRIGYFHMTCDHHTAELKEVADRLKAMPVEQLSGYLATVLCQESAWLQKYFDVYRDCERRFLALGGVSHARIVQVHAQILAAAMATQSLFHCSRTGRTEISIAWPSTWKHARSIDSRRSLPRARPLLCSGRPITTSTNRW